MFVVTTSRPRLYHMHRSISLATQRRLLGLACAALVCAALVCWSALRCAAFACGCGRLLREWCGRIVLLASKAWVT